MVRRTAVLVAVAIVVGGACGRSTSPTPALSTITAIRVSGPSTLAPQFAGVSTGTFTATGLRSDGSTEDDTARAVWTSSNSAVAHVVASSAGLVQAESPGHATISATLGLIVGSFDLVVAAPGTHTLSGHVTAADTKGPLQNVSVRVISGTGAGQGGTTDETGAYSIASVAGSVLVKLVADGFTTMTALLSVTSDTAVDFALTPVAPAALDLSGVWTMFLSASPSCRNDLAAAARDRQYAATIRQQSSQLTVTLTGSTIVDAGHDNAQGRFEIDGTLSGSTVELVIAGDTGYGYFSTADLYDLLSANERLGISGVVTGQAQSDRIQATMSGDLTYDLLPKTTFGPTGNCLAADHVITFANRTALGARRIRTGGQ